MTKTELIENVMKNNAGFSKKDIAEIVNSVFSEITDALSKKDSVSIIGFGTFTTVDKPERKGRNPATGAETTIAACTQAKFKPGKALKEAVNA